MTIEHLKYQVFSTGKEDNDSFIMFNLYDIKVNVVSSKNILLFFVFSPVTKCSKTFYVVVVGHTY